MTTTFAVERANLRRTRWLELDARPIEVGAVRMRIDRFALTSNNVTYAAFGEAMHYWDFYPTAELTLGCREDAVESIYAALLAGNVPAREGRVLSL